MPQLIVSQDGMALTVLAAAVAFIYFQGGVAYINNYSGFGWWADTNEVSKSLYFEVEIVHVVQTKVNG